MFQVGCAPTKKVDSKGPQLVMNSAYLKSHPAEMGFWMSFSLAKASCVNSYPASSFGEFLCATKLAMSISNSIQNKGDSALDGNLVLLNSLSKVGLLKEHLFYAYRQQEWFYEPNLKEKAYFQWIKENLKVEGISKQVGSILKNYFPTERKSVKWVGLKGGFDVPVKDLIFESLYQ